MSYLGSVSTAYQLCNIIYSILNSTTFIPRISVPVSISIPYNYSSKKDDTEIKDLDFFQMEKLLRWMKFFFDEEDKDKPDKDKPDKEDKSSEKEDKSDDECETKKAYKRELYNIYIGIRSDYKQYQNWVKYNNSIWLLQSYRSKNTKDLSKKIISDIQLFNEGLKMFSLFNKM